MKRYKTPLYLILVAAFYIWLVIAATTHKLPSKKSPILFYSNQKQQDLKLTFCRAIKEAKHSITLQMYAITDPDILKLLKISYEKGNHSSILYDKKASPNLEGINGKAGSSRGLMHRKIMVVDHSLVFLGSANMTTQSLRHHDNLVLGFFHPELASFLEQKETKSPFLFSIKNQKAELWLLPDKTDGALTRLVEEINSAKKRISIAIFTITHPQIIEALIKAHKRGIKVKVAVDFFTEKGASQKASLQFFNEGIPIYCSQGRQLLHHKWALIDRKKLIIGSANWTKAAFLRNQDCFLILNSLTTEQKKFMRDLWKTIKLESEFKTE